MKLLLDTHVLLWWLDEPIQLSPDARRAIEDIHNLVLVSSAVIWEVCIKQAIGRLAVQGDIAEAITKSGFDYLAISHKHAWATLGLPLHHRDPFDRMLVAQCLVEDGIIVTRDPNIPLYGVPCLLA